MTTVAAPDPEDQAFRIWLRILAERLTTDPEGALSSQGVLVFLWATFVENGAMPPLYFAALIGAHRQAHAQRTVTALLQQVHAETGRRLDVPVRYSPPTERDPEGVVRIGHDVVQGVDLGDIHAEAAEDCSAFSRTGTASSGRSAPTIESGCTPRARCPALSGCAR
ncbi:hypothetical protein ACPCB7_22160 [Streptomyces arboris]|uniref:hypothetical protein n=1 Tax=Streptomyces arboris TaxID=2600619 RepID=UPI003C2B5D00